MGRLLWLAAALAATGCGKVGTVGAVADAPDPDALSCAAPEFACAGSCVASTNDHCGDCGTACAQGTTCMADHCVEHIMSCADIKTINIGATSGIYTLADQTLIYCDMSAAKGYTSLIMAKYDSAPSGYTIVGSSDLTNAAKQTAFIALYNAQGGLTVPTAFTSGNCCFKNDANATNSMLYLQANDVYPAAAGVRQCSPAAGYDTATKYQFELLPDTAGHVFANAPLASNFFTTYPATATAGCDFIDNPAIFWKVTQ